jgi:Undecaprenyl-phosphate galactose phosphotransferase WbaP
MATAIIELTARLEQGRRPRSVLLRLTRRNSRALMGVVLACSDAASILVAEWIAIALRVALGYLLPSSILSRLAWGEAFSRSPELAHSFELVSLFLLVYAWRGLYPAIALSPTQEIRRLTITTSMAFLALATFMFILRTSLLYSRSIFALAWMLALILVPTARFMVRKTLARFTLWGEEVAVIQVGKAQFDLVAHLEANPEVGLRPALVVEMDPQSSITDQSLMQLAGHCRDRLGCAIVVSNGSLNEIAETVDRFRDIFMRVIVVDGRDRPRLNWEAAVDMAGVAGLEVRHNLLNRWAQVNKRAMDIVLSTLGIVVCAPLFLLLAVAVRLDSAGPVFFRQRRVGKDARLFGMLKFRTMVKDAEQELAEVLDSDPAKKLEWERFQKLRDDPRITRVGKLLRRYSLDELPQVWNVFRGEMSLVGPRPYFPEQEAAYGHGYENYVRVRPGITGLWQVSGRAGSPFADRIVLDETYVRTWSIWVDVYILAMTPAAVLSRNGAY